MSAPPRKIGFWFDYDQTWTFTALFTALRKRLPQLDTCGFVMNDRYFSHARENLPVGTRLERFYVHYTTGLASRPTREAIEALRPWDERLKLARIAYSDRHLTDYSHDQVIAATIHLKQVFEDFLDAERPEIFVFNCIASQFAHLFYELLRERGIQVVVPSFIGIGDLIYLSDNPFQHCPDVWETFRGFKAGSDAPSAEEAGFAKAFCDKVAGGSPAYRNAAVATEARRFSVPGASAILRGLINYRRYYRTDPTIPGLAERVITPLRLRLRRRAIRRFYTDPVSAEDKPFLYFPLHFEPEIATLVISPCDQRSVLDIVARRLPLTWRLLIKEHPAMAGQRAPSFYRDVLDRHPNVVFLDPSISSAALIRRCRAVLTLNGTPAIEAAIMGKPVITQALSRFGGLGLVPRLTDPFAFEETLDAALAAPSSRGDAELAVAAFRRHCYAFRFAEPAGDPTVLTTNNIGAMRDALLDHLAKS